jgi:hypothetical protein
VEAAKREIEKIGKMISLTEFRAPIPVGPRGEAVEVA